jgi:hypothetical protein
MDKKQVGFRIDPAIIEGIKFLKLKYKGVKNGRSKRIDETGKAEK